MASTTTERAGGILNLSPRQVRRYIADGTITVLRRANEKDRKRLGCPANTWILDGDSVLKLKRARRKAGL
jgi:hypothetical protein